MAKVVLSDLPDQARKLLEVLDVDGDGCPDECMDDCQPMFCAEGTKPMDSDGDGCDDMCSKPDITPSP